MKKETHYCMYCKHSRTLHWLEEDKIKRKYDFHTIKFALYCKNTNCIVSHRHGNDCKEFEWNK